MNTTTDDINSALLSAPGQLNIYFGSFLWIMGNIGSIGNMIVFRSRPFRNRAFAIYLLSEAILDFIYFNFVLVTRILEKGFKMSVTNQFNFICKVYQFASEWNNEVSFTLFSFATIDRILSTQRSNTYRQWSNRVPLSYKMVIICILFWLLLIGHRFIFYRIFEGTCSPLAGFYELYDKYFELIFGSVCPPIVMFILAYLLTRSVENVVNRRITRINNISSINVINNRSPLKQIDSNLTLMLLLQSLIAIITYVPYATNLIYTEITRYWPKSNIRIARENVFFELAHLCAFVFFASSFYISIISNIGFRRQIIHQFRRKKDTNLQN